jgi:DNA repair exonuclease SbcCD ATPase subunit
MAPKAAKPQSPTAALKTLRSLSSSREISILKLSEPITSASTGASASTSGTTAEQQRTSDVSNSSLNAPTPATLEADLSHYRELFAKLRFSYVEQVTKEKFIRAIVGDPPLIVTPQENLDLERDNAAAKAELKALKNEVADMVAELESRGRDLATRYEAVRLETTRLEELPGQIAGLEDAIADLKEANAETLSANPNPELNLPLAKTTDLVESRKRQRDELDRQLDQLKAQVPRKKKELERLQAELQPLEAKKATSTAAAKEAQRRREEALGGIEDDLEERGRWLRATESSLRQMLEI